ncbi:MBOAT family protein [Aureibaculum sp. A20]|uniref:MBOAT family protein n=2 Tax=Aureibaculum flavum TaxID=2795986 RepID=A0ABS0WKX9_9FLAO|nr:MBOAT family protein [Aureibaculum flavum]
MDYFSIRFPLPKLNLLLPVGISFYTFMAIGYLFDIYNEEIKAEKNIGLITLFLSFFPLVLSGPIERAPSMLPQFKSELTFNYEKAVQGFKFIIWGYFMKLVVADRIGIYTDVVLSNMEYHSGKTLLFTVLIYPLQLYADLGGYSLIAIGVAGVLGIKVRRNFNRPFFATTLSEFWRRWHMSLISWILDYVYTPLSFAFRRYKMKGVLLTVILTLFIMGMWHGATLTYLMWALFQGVVLSFEAITKNKKFAFEKKYNLSKKWWYIAFGISITYILFAFSFLTGGNRHTFSEGIMAFEKIINFSGSIFIDSPSNLIFIILGAFILLLKDFKEEFFSSRLLFFNNKLKIIRILSYSFIIILILLIGVFDAGQFIYFKF